MALILAVVLLPRGAEATSTTNIEVMVGSSPMSTSGFYGTANYHDGYDDYPLNLSVPSGSTAVAAVLVFAFMSEFSEHWRNGWQLAFHGLGGSQSGWKIGAGYGVDWVLGALEFSGSVGLVDAHNRCPCRAGSCAS